MWLVVLKKSHRENHMICCTMIADMTYRRLLLVGYQLDGSIPSLWLVALSFQSWPSFIGSNVDHCYAYLCRSCTPINWQRNAKFGKMVLLGSQMLLVRGWVKHANILCQICGVEASGIKIRIFGKIPAFEFPLKNSTSENLAPIKSVDLHPGRFRGRDSSVSRGPALTACRELLFAWRDPRSDWCASVWPACCLRVHILLPNYLSDSN